MDLDISSSGRPELRVSGQPGTPKDPSSNGMPQGSSFQPQNVQLNTHVQQIFFAGFEPNQIIDIPIQIQNPSNVRSFEGELSIDSDLIAFAGMSWSDATAGFMKQYQMDQET